jgi:homoserine kinase type II
MICQRGVTRGHATKVGEALARVHREGVGLSVGDGRFRPPDLFARIDLIGGASDETLASMAPVLRARLSTCLTARDTSLAYGLIHGDLFRDNVLWAPDGELSALLDFESASVGPFAYDLMVTVLSWCFDDDLNAGLARAVVDGYREVREIDEIERNGLLAEGRIAALRFAITRITDYAMRASLGPRVVKDWRRFIRRFDALDALDPAGLRRVLGL